MGKDVIVALDFPSKKEVFAFLDCFEQAPGKSTDGILRISYGAGKPFVKIGMELFYAEGPEIVREIRSRGHRIFLDLKLHDIPNTVRGGMRSLQGLGADMVNVHASGTIAMMEAAVEGLVRPDGTRPLIVAVTQLTSTSEERMREELWIDRAMEEVVVHYAQNAKAAGLDGVVCSPLEAGKIHDALGQGFLTVTPGIRFLGDAKGDQARITTPERARELGADYIVVGRSITAAPDPVKAYQRAVEAFCTAQ